MAAAQVLPEREELIMQRTKKRLTAALSTLVLATACASQSGAPAASVAQEAAPSLEATGPSFKKAVDICVRLGVSPLGCSRFQYPGQKVNGETEVGAAMVGGNAARISLYDTRSEVNYLLNHQNGRDRFGSRVDVVAGSNWTVTIVIADGEGHKTAKDVQVVLGGIVVLSGQG